MMGAPPGVHWAGLCAHADRVLWGFESAYGADDSGSCLAVFGLVRRAWRALWTACVSSCSAVGSRRSVSYSRFVRGDGAMLARVLEDIWAPSTSTGGGAVWPVRTSQVRAHSPGLAAFELSVSASRSRVASLVLSAYSPAVGSHHAHGRGRPATVVAPRPQLARSGRRRLRSQRAVRRTQALPDDDRHLLGRRQRALDPGPVVAAGSVEGALQRKPFTLV